jgi:hypothetical protein
MWNKSFMNLITWKTISNYALNSFILNVKMLRYSRSCESQREYRYKLKS